MKLEGQAIKEKRDVGLTSKVPLDGGSETAEYAVGLAVRSRGRSDDVVEGPTLECLRVVYCWRKRGVDNDGAGMLWRQR